jgi:hypothetical protein
MTSTLNSIFFRPLSRIRIPLMRIRIRILLFTLMRIRILPFTGAGLDPTFQFDPDLNHTSHFFLDFTLQCPKMTL